MPIAVFLLAAAIVYFGVNWTTRQPVQSKSENTLEGLESLQKGELVSLPVLTSPKGERVALSEIQTDKLLCVFFTPSCSGCAKDAELWRDLQQESGKQQTAYFLVDVGNDLSALLKFSDAHSLNELPILIDENHKVGKNLKINLVPQYVLFSRDGKVMRRWDGVRNYDSRNGSNQLSQFFLAED